MTVELLTEHHLVLLTLKGGCTCASKSTLVKIPHCWKSHCIFRGAKGGGGFGMFSMFKNLVGSKMLTREDLIPVLDKMREHLVGKIAHFGSND